MKPYKWIKDDVELLLDVDSGKPIRPYCDPVLGSNRKSVFAFLRILRNSHLLTWRTVLHCRVGLSFVPRTV